MKRISLALLASIFLYTTASHAALSKEEDQVREAWSALAAAIKAKDADKIWNLLDSDTQADAERTAKKVHAVYLKANAKAKAELEKYLGLSSAELTDLKPAMLFKSKRFDAKYYEIPDSKVTKVVVVSDQATVFYVEPDDDNEKLNFVRQGGKWRANMPLPKFLKGK